MIIITNLNFAFFILNSKYFNFSTYINLYICVESSVNLAASRLNSRKSGGNDPNKSELTPPSGNDVWCAETF